MAPGGSGFSVASVGAFGFKRVVIFRVIYPRDFKCSTFKRSLLSNSEVRGKFDCSGAIGKDFECTE